MRRPVQSLVVAALALLIAFLLRTHGAEARSVAESDYTKQQTYNAALRYLRVDLNYEIVEKDPEAAYLLFRYEALGQKGRQTSGSLEIIEAERRVKIVVQLPKMPSYHETMLRDGLLKKLRDEYGAPPPRPKPPKVAPPGDAGTD